MRKRVMVGAIVNGKRYLDIDPEWGDEQARKVVDEIMAPRPQIDHYMGRIVEDVIPEAGGQWSIELQGGARIVNLNDQYDSPDDSLVGLKLSFQTLSNSMTTLYFGTDENPRGTVVFLEPTQYGIIDPNYEDGELVRPQSSVEERDAAGLPVADEERIATGPSEAFHEASAQREADIEEERAQQDESLGRDRLPSEEPQEDEG